MEICFFINNHDDSANFVVKCYGLEKLLSITHIFKATGESSVQNNFLKILCGL